jgi:hypothetical protein
MLKDLFGYQALSLASGSTELAEVSVEPCRIEKRFLLNGNFLPVNFQATH